MHSNAQITSNISATSRQCETILSLLPRTQGGAGQSAEDVIKQKCREMLDTLPRCFDIDMVAKKFPIIYAQSMNTVAF